MHEQTALEEQPPSAFSVGLNKFLWPRSFLFLVAIVLCGCASNPPCDKKFAEFRAESPVEVSARVIGTEHAVMHVDFDTFGSTANGVNLLILRPSSHNRTTLQALFFGAPMFDGKLLMLGDEITFIAPAQNGALHEWVYLKDLKPTP